MLRSGTVGLALGLLLAALVLGGSAAWQLHVDCSRLSSVECAFETQAHREVARFEALGAVGSALLAMGLLLFLRRR